MVKYIRQSSLIRACQRPVRSSYFFARKEGWRRSRSRFVSCLPKAFWTSRGLAIRLAANGSVSSLEDCLEAAAFRDAEELGQAVGGRLLGHCVISFRRLRARSMWRRGVVCVVFLKACRTWTVPRRTSA